MREYKPDNWAIVKIVQENSDCHYRVAAGWQGGYTYGRSWKLSSGVDSIIEKDDYYEIHNTSGSIYNCFKHSYGLDWYTESVIATYQKESEVIGTKITVLQSMDAYFEDLKNL